VVSATIPTTLVEADRTSIHVCLDVCAALLPSKAFRRAQESSSQAAPLKIVTNRNASKRGHDACNVDTDDTYWRLAVPKQHWVVARPPLVGTVGIVGVAHSAELEEDAPTDRVVRHPVVFCRKSTKLWRLHTQVSRGDVFASAKIASM
jgi:hypothetical protein